MNQNILGGQIDMGIGSIALLSGQVRAARCAPSPPPARSARRPCPMSRRSSSRAFRADGLRVVGIYAPAGTPKPIIDRFNAELVKVLSLPDVRRRSAKGWAWTWW